MKKQVLLLIFIAFAFSNYATPESGVGIKEAVIGYNDNYFYTFQMNNYILGTYYAAKDSVFLLEKELSTGKIKSKIFVNSRHHFDKDANGRWETTISENSDLNFIDYVESKNIKYLYPTISRTFSYRNLKLIVDFTGLKLKLNGETELIVGFDKLEIFAPWVKHYLDTMGGISNKGKYEYVKAFCTIGDSEYIFFTIKGQMSGNYTESIIPIKKSELSLKVLEIIN